jgi:hypothetical protein
MCQQVKAKEESDGKEQQKPIPERPVVEVGLDTPEP